MDLQKLIDNGTIKRHEVGWHILGKWWPELGSYQEWSAGRMAEAEKYCYILEVDSSSTQTGGCTLSFRGIEKIRLIHLLDGTACPNCIQTFDKADDTAIHLINKHKYDYEKTRLWLRDKVEEVAFAEEA